MRLLDLFCCAGGAAKGYVDAGFEVVGVDIKPQPHYPFEFHQADALELLDALTVGFRVGATDESTGWWLRDFDAIHASPPCQGYSAANNVHGADHPLLIDATRDRLIQTGIPYVIENVEGARAHMRAPVMICGLSLGLNVRRHRLFECSFPVMVPPCADHRGQWLQVFGTGAARVRAKGFRPSAPWDETQEAMGIDWMTRAELSEAIPPAYTELIGGYLLSEIEHGCTCDPAVGQSFSAYRLEREIAYDCPQHGAHVASSEKQAPS